MTDAKAQGKDTNIISTCLHVNHTLKAKKDDYLLNEWNFT